MQLKRYNRQKAIDYARKWALDRNPIYHDYEKYGGDCTNFISQCFEMIETTVSKGHGLITLICY